MSLAEVRLQEGESIDNALRRFKRKVQTEDIIKEVKRHSEAGRKAPGEASLGAKACSKEDSQGLRVSPTKRGRCYRAAARERGTMRRIYVSFANIAGLGGDGGAEHRIGCRAGHGCG